jgi:hypothetical protein
MQIIIELLPLIQEYESQIKLQKINVEPTKVFVK